MLKSEQDADDKERAVSQLLQSLQQQTPQDAAHHHHKHGGGCCQHKHGVASGLPMGGGLPLDPARLAQLSKEEIAQLQSALQERIAQQMQMVQQQQQQEEEEGGAAQELQEDMDIFDAVKMGLMSVVRRIVDEAPRPLDVFLSARDAEGHTLAHWAAKRGDLNMLQFLADRGAPLYAHSEDRVGMQPLHWAATEGHLPVMHFLVTRGADINGRDKQQCPPLLVAAQYGQTEAVAYLVKNGADTGVLDVNQDSAMHWAAYKGELAIVQLLHHLGLAPDEADSYGQTPLHLASLRGNFQVVEYLVLDADVSTTSKDKNGATALDLAVRKEHKRVAALLRSRVEEPLTWRQLLSASHWKGWLMGGSTADGAKWPFYFVLLACSWCHALFPMRFQSERAMVALADYGRLQVWAVSMQLLMWVFFLLVWKTDPGYIDPKKDKSRRLYDEALEYFSSQGMEAMLQGGANARRPPQLCHSCHVTRPIRSKHCRVCRKCVRVFDHHCPFVGNCVGANNYRWFFLYILTTLVACALFVWLCGLYLRLVGLDMLVLVSLVLVLAIGLMVGALAFYHVQLVALNLTTNEHHNFWRYEYFKDASGRVRNPFDSGFFRNCASRLCNVGDEEPEPLAPDSERLLTVV